MGTVGKSADYKAGFVAGLRCALIEARSWLDASEKSLAKFDGPEKGFVGYDELAYVASENVVRGCKYIHGTISDTLEFYEEIHREEGQ